MSEVIKKIKTERDKFKDMYQNVNSEYSMIKNKLDDVDKKNEKDEKKLIKYKEMKVRIESEVRNIMKSIDDKKNIINNIGSDVKSEK